MRVTILFGAFASVPAGIPTSYELTDRLLESIGSTSKHLLYFVYGGLLMQTAARERLRSSRGDVRIDVEALFNAVEGLATRADLDAAPFVTSWHPLIDEIETPGAGRSSGGFTSRSAVEQAIASALREAGQPNGRHRLGSAAADVMRQLERHFEQRPTSVRGFAHLSGEMVTTLDQLLGVGSPQSVEYMLPLFQLHDRQPGGLTIASLNYDMVVESAASAANAVADDGLDSWIEGSGLEFSDGSVHLLKLHGSFSWIEKADGSVGRRNSLEATRQRPAVVFGGHNKLRADGPFLDLLWEWRAEIGRSDHLVIVGYSFRDPHINAVLDSRLRRDPLARTTIVDPSPSYYDNPTTRRLHAASNVGLASVDSRPGHPRDMHPEQALHAPVQFIKEGAAEAFSWLFDAIPTWPETAIERRPYVPDAEW
jgi:hypothetical protein